MNGPDAVCFDAGWMLLYPRQSMWEVLAAVAGAAGADLDAAQCETLVPRRRPGSLDVARDLDDVLAAIGRD
jgi:hypothetical protein